MSEYTPGTNEVRFNYTTYEAEHTRRGLSGSGENEFAAEFDRWLEEERRKAVLDYEMNRKVSVTVENIDGKAAREWHAEELRKAKAEAWEEGWAARASRPHLKRGECVPPPPHINPYRADQEEEA